MKIILFADPGIDDSLAIMYAILHPEIELLAVVTSYGNVSVSDSTKNAAYLLHLANHPEIPVIVGASHPFTEEPQVFYPGIHGEDGLGPYTPPDDFSASIYPFEKVFEIIEQHIDEVVIVDVGRQTSLGIAFNLKPELMKKVQDIYLMGGAFQVPGNVTSLAEANFYGDPNATNIVLNYAKQVHITPLNVTNRAILSREVAVYIYRLTANPYKELLRVITQYYANYYEKVVPGIKGAPIHDVFTLYYLLNKDKTYTIERDVNVVIANESKGLSVADLRATYDKPTKKHSIALQFDYRHFIEDFISIMIKDVTK
ncbi:nucleoside hydrolase [Bacillus coahuilensis]|uniref:nucleoside hydrolase n=1 Tax=Bacillus coahuilensis TaxID=408580 RepID=UPI0009EBA143|nr:nucleoside hydrolase [Bacillus coahuilensis]